MTMLIGQNAPSFNSMVILPNGSVDNEFNYADYVSGKMAVLFFFSMAFSFIDPTELIALRQKFKAFQQKGVVVTAITCDSYLAIQQWLATPPEQGGTGPLPFPVASDPTRKISAAYGVLVNDTLPLRATFLIDKLGVVRSQMVNDFHMGRNIDEILRLIDAHQHHEDTGRLCPANWQEGRPSLTSDRDELAKYLRKYSDIA